MSIQKEIKLFLSWLVSVYMLSFGMSTQAAEMALSNSPLFLGTQIDPNIFFMLDDSGSMDWEILTQPYHYYTDYWSSASTVGLRTDGYFRMSSSVGASCTGTRNYAYIYSNSINSDNVYNSCSYVAVGDHSDAAVRDWRVRNAFFNIMYYNPSATYNPWNGYSNASFTAARSNPVVGSAGYSRLNNLTGFVYDVWVDDKGFTGPTAEGYTNVTDTPNGLVDLYDKHTQYTVGASSVTKLERSPRNAAWITSNATNCGTSDATTTPQYVNCFGTVETSSTISGAVVDDYGRTYSEIQQNVANWYQYHRRRSFAAKSAISQVMSSNTSFRFGISLLNDSSSLFVEVPDELITDFDPHNDALLESMFEYTWRSNGTPLRRGLEIVGRYYSDYYSGTYVDPIISSCQQNYSVLFTDGYWSGGDPLTVAISDEDGDGFVDTLADVARYFYTEDLSPLPNDVPTSTIDQNSQQHMVTFTVAFGVDGNLVDTDGDRYPNPALLESDVWGGGSFDQ